MLALIDAIVTMVDMVGSLVDNISKGRAERRALRMRESMALSSLDTTTERVDQAECVKGVAADGEGDEGVSRS